MAVCSTTALRKYLTQRSNLGQPLREKAVSTTRGHAEGETLTTSGAYRRPLFKSSHGASFGGCSGSKARALLHDLARLRHQVKLTFGRCAGQLGQPGIGGNLLSVVERAE